MRGKQRIFQWKSGHLLVIMDNSQRRSIFLLPKTATIAAYDLRRTFAGLAPTGVGWLTTALVNIV